MTATQARFDEDEDLWKAIPYCDNHWAALIRFLDHRRIPLTKDGYAYCTSVPGTRSAA